MTDDLVYLDSYVLQQDMRIRLPKQILANIEIEKGVSMFDIFIDKKNDQIILKKSSKQADGGK